MDFLEVETLTTSEIIINKSRFIGILFPAETESVALNHLNSVKKQYKNATHHCFAYMVGQNRGIMRYSDDGEPQGTAGIPILEVLKQSDLTNVLFVCVRYFGGVLLGAGGLTRAYSSCTVQTVLKANKLKVTYADQYVLSISYPVWSKVEPYLHQHGATVTNVQYADKVTATVYEPVGAGVVKKAALEISNGSAICEYMKIITVKTPIKPQ